MKICLKCDKPIDEEGESKYVMIITKRKNEITEFDCFHFDCWQKRLDGAVLEEVKEKMNKCCICKKKIRFWSSYVKDDNYYCKECWKKREEGLEGAREEKERVSEEKSRKKDESVNDSQKTL